ncbi:Transposon Tf2-9 polyprotein [Dictyocoela muelleri]|nr:Transposon Tf2-9 polyprotein [Dictyocoela muelleri]
MSQTIIRYLTCKNLHKQISEKIGKCEICQKNKDYKKNIRPYGEPIFTNKAFDFISTDILGPLKVKHLKYKLKSDYFYILTITDIYSRLTKPYILFDIKSNTVINKIENWIKEFRPPSKLLSDPRRQFISLAMKNLMMKYAIKHIMTSPYNPRANGILERINRSKLQVCGITKGIFSNEL